MIELLRWPGRLIEIYCVDSEPWEMQRRDEKASFRNVSAFKTNYQKYSIGVRVVLYFYICILRLMWGLYPAYCERWERVAEWRKDSLLINFNTAGFSWFILIYILIASSRWWLAFLIIYHLQCGYCSLRSKVTVVVIGFSTCEATWEMI